MPRRARRRETRRAHRRVRIVPDRRSRARIPWARIRSAIVRSMDSRAKQRLTGAVILVAVFVLFVPELLTGPGKNSPADTPAEEGLRRYTIDLDAQSKPAQPEGEASEPAVALPAIENPPPATLATPGESAAPEVESSTPGRAIPAPASGGNDAAAAQTHAAAAPVTTSST